MKKVIALILSCFVCFSLIAFSSCKKEEPLRVELRSADDEYSKMNIDTFSGTDMEEFVASLNEIKTRDDEHKVYKTMYDKIVLEGAGIYIPEDEESITYLGVSGYNPNGSLTLNSEGVVEHVEIIAKCIFTCGGAEYEATLYTYNNEFSPMPNETIMTYKLGDGKEVEFIKFDSLRKKYVRLCRYKVGEDIIIIMPVNGSYFEDAEFTDFPEDIFEFSEIFNLKKVSLKELIE